MSKITEALFSKPTSAVLNTVFMHPQGMHLRALMHATGLGSASAQRELKKLADAGILEKEEVGRVLVYRANAKCPVYFELRAIVQKTEGVSALLAEALNPYSDHIERAFIYGSLARHEDTASSDIDVLVIADGIGSAELYPPLVEAEHQLGRKVSPTIYRPDEYRRKLKAGNHFLASVIAGPKIELIRERDERAQGA